MDNKPIKAPIPFAQALKYWLKLGFISFGGPAGQISMMHQELVDRRRWISDKRFLHALNYTMILPGPEAQQLATYIGWLLHGVKGGIAAGVLFVLPSFIILVALTYVYLSYGSVKEVASVLYMIKPAVVAIVLFAAYRIGTKTLSNWVLTVLASLAFIAIYVASVPFPIVVLSAGVIGVLGAWLTPRYFAQSSHSPTTSASVHNAVIGDESPIPEHARFSWRNVMRVAVIGIGLWLALVAGLVLQFGWDGTYTRMSWFFTKAALVTFGGAYAVLPYVYQGGVEQYSWLTATQMIDGLALGETTPGPLIMVVAFVGFVGGWAQAVLGVDALFLSGFIGALVVTVVTFIPSFLFILIGGPLVEATRGNLKFTAPLTAITAAVVGVILSLATFFASHVFWPQGFSSQFDWLALALSATAFIALQRFNLSIVLLVLTAGALGLARSLFI